MKKLIFIYLLLPLVLYAQEGEREGTKKTQIAILGVFHFDGTTDMASVKINNLHSIQRQAELKSIVEKLKEFNPTKILVEYPAESNDRLFTSYTNYLSGKDTLNSSETHQIGFRLTKALGHKKLYGIDHKLEMPMQKIMEYCQQNDRMGDFQALANSIVTFAQRETQKLEGMMLTEFLVHMNSENYDQMFYDLYYYNMLDYGNIDNEAGIEYATSWYKRNLNIFKNLTETFDGTDDRVLVIIGSNHRAGLKQFVEARNDMEYVEVSQYLK
ncbi:MAG: DUF5694 domain-containing protein [Fulvivirga sp.]|nr:DUF5694 domain-containing protein [Fulvivirga sp.]